MSTSTAQRFAGYWPIPGAYDELIRDDGTPRPELERVVGALRSFPPQKFAHAQALAELAVRNQGVTFSVHADDRGRSTPIAARDVARVERGLTQRIRALDLFLDDVYGPQRFLSEGVPAELVLGARTTTPSCAGCGSTSPASTSFAAPAGHAGERQARCRACSPGRIVTRTDHIRVAVGRNDVDATPTSGTLHAGGGRETLEVAVQVQPAGEPGEPRQAGVGS